MKPVVSSLVALALALAPVSAFAKPAHPKTAHVVKHKTDADKGESAKVAEKVEKSEKSEKSEKIEKSESIVRVKAGKKDGAHGHSALKPVVHHAHNVDLGGPGHKEPKAGAKEGLVPASLITKAPEHKSASERPAHGKNTHAKPASKSSELPKLPNPNAGKPSKGGAEKGAKKPSEKKSEAGDANDGEPARDEELAELVARIRGHRTATSDATGVEPVIQKDKPDVARDTKSAKNGARAAATPCSKEPVEIVRGPEVERFALTKCDGTVAPLAVEHLSVLIRPGGAERPTAPIAELAKKPGPDLAHGIRRVDARLIERIQSLADHFGKPGTPAKLSIISGYRPASVGSMHSTGRAIDFRIEGVKNEDVVAFCKTLGDTGCGYYPNSSFVHVDVRDPGAGHVTWIDASGPGETPRYVSSWPPASPTAKSGLERASAVEVLAEEGAKLLKAERPLDHENPAETADEHPAAVIP